ncbi:hypothetical protein B0H65DRAFT_523069 [Neurospora tetraspora]|uniref:Polynucleotide 5'-hydroxyl-kinase GRC3 n=1 Tax=Neurospora tetraspora TaxID=94610 RepID=A0AAE0MT24_9PEZI|nr:hypothetical protein B0H65DRAFT_523069 [Neurospora tetraspora]
MSAFAARQKLLGLSAAAVASAAATTPNVDDDDNNGDIIDRNTSAKSFFTRDNFRKALQAQKQEPSDDVDEKPVARPRKRKQGPKDELPAEGREEGRQVKSQFPNLSEPIPTGRRRVIYYSSQRLGQTNIQLKANGRMLLKLLDGERLVILGSYGIKVREGELTIAGAFLSKSDLIHWVHAPLCHALPVIRITSDATIELHPHPGARSLRQLASLNPAFGKLWNESDDVASGQVKKAISTFQIIFTSDDGPKRGGIQELVSPAEWNKQLADVLDSKTKATPVVFLSGPKSSGKSTFGRLMANRLITGSGLSRQPWAPVVVLDLDPGQPEFGPPSVISLNKLSSPNLSPPFCHPALDSTTAQLRAHTVASVTPSLDPDHFVACALDLFHTYKTNPSLNKLPLIINTPGWIQGTGLDILSELIRQTVPTEVIYMSQDGPEETVDGLKAACQDKKIPFVTVPSQQPQGQQLSSSTETTTTSGGGSSRTALHLRTMQTMSYFHLLFSSLTATAPQGHQVQSQSQSQTHPGPTWSPTPLTHLPPWRVRYRGPRPGFLGILCYDHQPAPDLLAEAINGMILALVKIEDRAGAFRDFPDLLVSPQEQHQQSKQSKQSQSVQQFKQSQSQKPELLICKTPRESLPHLPNPQGKTLSPAHSRVLGLVLVRGIDVKRGELQLLTPLPFEVITEKDQDLVLVAGRFDTPSWAYAEDLHRRQWERNNAAARNKAAGHAGQQSLVFGGGAKMEIDDDNGEDGDQSDETESVGADEVEERPEMERVKALHDGTSEAQPWVEMLHGSQGRAAGSKVWRVRRDLGRR